VGDTEPPPAIADALPTFPADEIVDRSQPESSSRLADELMPSRLTQTAQE
jgi:hypothetical protein